MEAVYNLIQHRNSIETLPFLSIHASNAHLQNLVDTLQCRCESIERQYLEQQQLVADQAKLVEQLNDSSSSSKSEVRLREKVAKLQEELNTKIDNEVKSTAEALEKSKEFARLKEEKNVQDVNISKLKMEASQNNDIIAHLTSELEESKSRTRLAEAQFDGLKEAIRSYQEENEEIKKLNNRLVENAVTEKEKMANQFNNMNDEIEKLKKEVNMLRSYTKMEKTWFGFPRRDKLNTGIISDSVHPESVEEDETRQWGYVGAVMPTQPLCKIKAHKDDATCVRYDGTNLNSVATTSSDATVKVWDTGNGQIQATFSGGGSQPMLGVDISGGVVCGCGADKTCRVWKYDTRRMIHQLAGHSQKITCVRLFPGEKSILTGSADRSIRVWDISRHIYNHTTTFRHSSTTNCADVSGGMHYRVVTGHLDGGARFWDVRSGDQALDIPSLHEGGVTSVQWKPGSSHEILTSGRDSTLKIVDARNQCIVGTFQEKDFRTLTNHASSSFSPDGAYIAAGSGDNGDVFVWNVSSGDLEKRLNGGHEHGVTGLAWGRGGSNGQQVATIDKSGVLVMWA